MTKINIAELLKNCPKGMELDCASYDNVSFDKISDDKKAVYPIFCYITDKEGNRSGISFTENGCESKRHGAKCVIFPKGKTTWEGFVPPYRFKEGDRVRKIDTHEIHIIDHITASGYVFQDEGGMGFIFENEHIYELASNKFDINTLKPFESRVLVRDEDLGCRVGEHYWRAAIYGGYIDGIMFPYHVIGGLFFHYCIPYEGNEHLLGTTDDCDEFYKTWEE